MALFARRRIQPTEVYDGMLLLDAARDSVAEAPDTPHGSNSPERQADLNQQFIVKMVEAKALGKAILAELDERRPQVAKTDVDDFRSKVVMARMWLSGAAR